MANEMNTVAKAEARKRRWYVGGALASALVAIGGVAAIAKMDAMAKGHEVVKTGSSPPLPEVVAQFTEQPKVVATAAVPDAGMPEITVDRDTIAVKAEPVFAPVEEEKLALAHVDATPVDHLAKADELEKAGDKDGALVEARRGLADKEDDTVALWKVATLAQDELGDRALERLVKVAKNDAEAPREIARRRLNADDAKGALPFALEACHREPTSWEAWQLKGRALMGEGKLGPAITAFKKATEQSAAPGAPFNNLGYALLLSGRANEAVTALDTAIERGPVSALMMNNLGLAYEKLGRLDEAEVAFLGALELKSDYVKAQVNLDRVGAEKDALAKADEAEKVNEAKTAKENEENVSTKSGETGATGSGAEHTEPGPMHGG